MGYKCVWVVRGQENMGYKCVWVVKGMGEHGVQVWVGREGDRRTWGTSVCGS